MEKQIRQTTSVNNTELYNRWAKVSPSPYLFYSSPNQPQCYDTDGNILQAIDDLEIPSLLTQFFALLSTANPSPSQGVKITELGCGTGRNTSKLLQPPFISQTASIHGLDLSPEMLQVAQRRCSELLSVPRHPITPPDLSFHIYDALSRNPIPADAQNADGVISTLVLEHLPLDVFFRTAASLLRKARRGADGPSQPGYLLVTNMHAEMGSRSQAGFVDAATGAKVRGHSLVYSVDEMLREAGRWGFSLVGEGEGRGVRERAVEEGDLEAGTVGKRGRKWVGCMVWFGCVLRLDAAAGLREGEGESA